MNPWLAEMYGTGSGQTDADEGLQKQAQLELFAKVAADEGIDLTTLSPAQVNELYTTVFAKTAEEGEDEGSEEDEKEDEEEEKAKEEHEAKKEGAAKLAEAELMGQVMAHSFVHELNEIEKSAAMPAALAKGLEAAGKAGKSALSKGQELKGAATRAGGSLRAAAKTAPWSKDLTKRHLSEAAQHAKPLSGVGKAVAGTAAVGGTYALGKSRGKKEASAFDTIAARNAIKLASAAGYDEGEAVRLIESVYNLGLEDSEKVAYIEDTSDALHVRSLEYLEKAGYPVNWEEVFGS